MKSNHEGSQTFEELCCGRSWLQENRDCITIHRVVWSIFQCRSVSHRRFPRGQMGQYTPRCGSDNAIALIIICHVFVVCVAISTDSMESVATNVHPNTISDDFQNLSVQYTQQARCADGWKTKFPRDRTVYFPVSVCSAEFSLTSIWNCLCFASFYSEYYYKYNLSDNKIDDTLNFTLRRTWIFQPQLSNGLTGDENITMIHPGALNQIHISKRIPFGKW